LILLWIRVVSLERSHSILFEPLDESLMSPVFVEQLMFVVC